MAEISTGDDGRTGSWAAGAGSAAGPYANPFADPPPAPAPPPAPRRDRAALAKGAGLVAAGLLVGALVTSALQGGGSSASASAAPAAAAAPAQGGTGTQDGTGGLGGPGFGGQGAQGFGGQAGEEHVTGTISKVTGSSLTVQGSDGSTATYTVDSSTQIAKDGQLVQLSDLQAGDQVLVHVLSGDVAERILVGTAGGTAGQLPGGGTQAPQDTTTQGGTGSET